MKYYVTVNGEEREVVLDGDAVLVEDARLSAHLADVEDTPVRLVTVGAEVHRVLVRRGERRGMYTLSIDGFRYEVVALDERSHTILALSGASAAGGGPATLVAPMPGLVVRVNVEVGQAVEAGQGLVVMEAMKMENELRASHGGVVRAVLVSAGTAVEKGTVLLQLE